MSEERHFPNPSLREPACLPAAQPEPSKPGEVPADLRSRLLADLEALVAHCHSAYCHAPSSRPSVYTGSAGIALLHLHLATTLYADSQEKSRAHLQQAHSLLSPCLLDLPSRDVTFLCGAGGPLAIAAVLEASLGRPEQARVRFVHLMSQAYKALGDARYLSSAERCGAAVWERGLLKKGYGLCHGAAGNSYTFLQLYRLTGQAHHWNRALRFAEWCATPSQRATRTPDCPLSLFEGVAGVAFFYNDIIMMSSHGHAPFPCLEIPQPRLTFSLPQE